VLLNWTRRHFLASFPIIVTADQVGSYKPAPGHFLAARTLIGSRRWVHTAQSYFATSSRPARRPTWRGSIAGRPRLTAASRPGISADRLADWLAP
jgi:hypothetical protein